MKILASPRITEILPGGLWGILWEHDRALLDFMWMDEYPMKRPRHRSFDLKPLPLRSVRKMAVIPYDLMAKDLLYVNQGPRGPWQDTCAACHEQRAYPCIHISQPVSLTLEELVTGVATTV